MRPTADVIDSKTVPPNPPVATVQTVNRGLPTQLKIPRLGVDAPVSYMGITAAGDMDTPASLSAVGWYKYGPLPGNEGSAVISGHVTGPRGVPGVFTDLDKMQVGDLFSVIDSTGQSTNFVVRDIQTYNQDAKLSQVFTSTNGAHLNLISCTGDWDKVQRHFLQRLVIYSDKVT